MGRGGNVAFEIRCHTWETGGRVRGEPRGEVSQGVSHRCETVVCVT